MPFTYWTLLTSNASYYDLDRQTSSVDARGAVTEYQYDSLGRQIATIGPQVSIGGVLVRHRTETVYDDQGRVSVQRANIIQDESGKDQHDESNVQRTSYTYDQRGNVTRTTYDDGSFAEVRYDQLGRVIAESKPVAVGTQLAWSEGLGSFIDSTTQRLIPTRTLSYDLDSRLVAVSLPAVADASDFNALSRPTYQYGYDAGGQQTLIVDPNGHQTRLHYNALGQQTGRTLPLEYGPDGIFGNADDAPSGSFTETFAYDQRGRQELHVSFEGIHTVNVYEDLNGRLNQVR